MTRRNAVCWYYNETPVAGRTMDPQRCPHLFPRTCEHGPSFGKRELTQVMTVTDGDVPQPRGYILVTEPLKRGELSQLWSENGELSSLSREPGVGDTGDLGKLGKTENRSSPGDPGREHSPADAVVLAQADPGQTCAVELWK